MSEKERPVAQNTGVIKTPVDSTEPDVATLSLTYRDGRPILTVSDGVAIPGGLTVEDENGKVVAIYKVETQAGSQIRSFPPTHSNCILQEPVQLFDGHGKMEGTLEGFDVIVNRSSVPT